MNPKSPFKPTIIEAMKKYTFGGFTFMPFECKHDAPCLGFLIKHPEIGVLLFVTDSYFIPYTFAGLTNIMIEANYRIDLLQKNIDAGRIPAALRTRTLESHMSIDTCRSLACQRSVKGEQHHPCFTFPTATATPKNSSGIFTRLRASVSISPTKD